MRKCQACINILKWSLLMKKKTKPTLSTLQNDLVFCKMQIDIDQTDLEKQQSRLEESYREFLEYKEQYEKYLRAYISYGDEYKEQESNACRLYNSAKIKLKSHENIVRRQRNKIKKSKRTYLKLQKQIKKLDSTQSQPGE